MRNVAIVDFERAAAFAIQLELDDIGTRIVPGRIVRAVAS
jgi:hypothetical protein